jgi:hypothetical protein
LKFVNQRSEAEKLDVNALEEENEGREGERGGSELAG